MSGGSPPHSRPVRRPLPRWTAALGAVLLALVCQRAGLAANAAEYEVKSAFLVNFIKFVDWPADAFADANAPLVVAVLGSGPSDVLQRALNGRSVRDRSILVRQYDVNRDVGPVHVLFVFHDATADLPAARQLLRRQPVLTISEVPDAAVTDAVINLTPVGTRLGFCVNLDRADEAGLRISPSLLTLSREVRSARVKGRL